MGLCRASSSRERDRVVLGLVEQRERWGCANWRGSSKLFPRFSTQKYEENYFHSFSTIFHEIFLYIFFPSFFLHSKQGKEINFLNFFSFHLIFLGPNTLLDNRIRWFCTSCNNPSRVSLKYMLHRGLKTNSSVRMSLD